MNHLALDSAVDVIDNVIMCMDWLASATITNHSS